VYAVHYILLVCTCTGACHRRACAWHQPIESCHRNHC